MAEGDLGIPRPAILLAVERRAACDGLPAELADAVFLVEAASQIEAVPAKARLGVMIEAVEDGVRISKVLEGSVAAATKLAPGDLVVRAAGFPINKISELIEIVQRQAPGTWLPITIQRLGQPVEVVAKFPTAFAEPE